MEDLSDDDRFDAMLDAVQKAADAGSDASTNFDVFNALVDVNDTRDIKNQG